MTLQQKTLNRYRQFFPQETLREISARTGIQITRVFRLLNGKNMKVGEFEAFEKAISDKIAENPQYLRLNELLDKSGVLLTNEEMDKLADYMERKIATRSYARSYIKSTCENAIIA